ncbi:MAG: cytochrome c3 family protein [Planctomycetes bacterium]|nr:cytochrome c3 family protein [Planctomycetota bacterium]
MNSGVIVLSIGFLTFGAAIIYYAGSKQDELDFAVQPVEYNHSKHVALGIDCSSCHTGATDGTHAGIPSTSTCALCHKIDRDFPSTPPQLARYIKGGEEIPWIQLHKAPRHIYFSHQRHVKLGKLDCAVCHGDVKTMEKPFGKSYFPSGLTGMNKCVACHLKEKVTTDCLSCHR